VPVSRRFTRLSKRSSAARRREPARSSPTGLSREALDGIIRLGGERVIYVSCDVATLARDARRLVDAGYDIEKIDAFDMFPNTPHVETVVVFVRGVRL
jgi:23S rRNA (uracil1939-C5)-methyltransferase